MISLTCLITGAEELCLYSNVKIAVISTSAVGNVECSLLNTVYISLQGHFEVGRLQPLWS